MAIISEYQEENNTNKPTSSSPQPKPQSTPFTANFDPSNPTAFLNKVFEFLGNQTNFLEKDTAEKEILASLRGVKAKKAKIVAEEKAKAERKLIEEKAKAAAAAKKEKEDDKSKDGEGTSLAGKRILTLHLCICDIRKP